MLLYSYVDTYQGEPRYYFNYGEMVLDLLFPDWTSETRQEYASPFLPALQDGASPTATASEANQFLRDLCPYPEDGPFDITNIWPLPIYAGTTDQNANNLIFRTLLVQYIIPKYWESYLLPYGREDTEEEKAEVYKKFFDRFAQLCIATFHTYAPIIKAFKEKEGQLLAQVQSTSDLVNRFNDTPQEGGDYADENHTTTATTANTITRSDYETPINRLREIREKYENLYNAWAKDFDILFTKAETGEL